MNNSKVIVILLSLIINAIDYCHAQVTLPLYLNSKVAKSRLKKATSSKDEFQSSIVYETMNLLRRSERGKNLIKVMKRTRLAHLRNVNNRSKKRTGRSLRKKDRKLHHHYPLFQGYGSHYVSAWIGSPPQRVSLLIDTGSYVTAFPCAGCTSCGDDHTDPYFDPVKSKTFKSVSCDGSFGSCTGSGDAYCQNEKCMTNVAYLEGSEWTGYQATDQFFLGNNEDQEVGNSITNEFTFVCQESETGLFQTQLENGIMGLQDSDKHLPNVLRKTNKIPVNQFSLCLRVEKFADKEGFHAGLMTIGGVDDSYHSSPMMYARTQPGYNVQIRAIYLQKSPTRGTQQGRSLNDYRKVPIATDYSSNDSHTVDSGTTITYFASEYAPGFKTEWKSLTGSDLTDQNTAITLSNEQVSNLPTIFVQIEAQNEGCDESQTINEMARKLDSTHCNDVILSFPPSHYLSKEGDTYYINFSFEELGIDSGILGANIIQGHDVLFDIENSRLGFASSTCKYKST